MKNKNGFSRGKRRAVSGAKIEEIQKAHARITLLLIDAERSAIAKYTAALYNDLDGRCIADTVDKAG